MDKLTESVATAAPIESVMRAERAGRRDLRFNYYSIPAEATRSDYYANDPVWQLVSCEVDWWVGEHSYEADLFARGRPSRGRGRRIAEVSTGQLGLQAEALLLPVEFSYCSYLIQDLGADSGGLARAQGSAQQLAEARRRIRHDLPAQPRTEGERRRELSVEAGAPMHSLGSAGEADPIGDEALWIRRFSHSEASEQFILYLFNVIVALEWEPDAEDHRQLAWAFRRASDYLYDVSDGSMAFGQVLIGWGEEYMRVADIQIAASNRMQGRAWAGGIHEASKRKPVRLGRGEWRRTYAIPWDEPEGYRVIVHEWAHYALHLRDAYLDRIPVEQFTERASRVALRRASGTPKTHLLVPRPYLLGLSILETLDGVSELSIRFDDTSASPVLASERDLVDALYPSAVRVKNQVENGPGALPLPLPQILLKSGHEPPLRSAPLLRPRDQLTALRLRGLEATGDETLAPYDRCWLYVYRGGSEPKLLAQGTLDIRAPLQDFRLLGAAPGDQLLAVVYGRDFQPTVYTGAIGAGTPAVETLTRRALPVLPIIELLPDGFDTARPIDPDEEPEPIGVAVRLRETAWSVRPTRIWICPLGEPVSEYDAEKDVARHENAFTRLYGPRSTQALDGHVVLWYGETPIVCSYSHGGNPPKNTVGAPSEPRPIDIAPAPSPDGSILGMAPQTAAERRVTLVPFVPITAGSSDGNVRIYFEVERESDFRVPDRLGLLERFNAHYSRVRVVTAVRCGARAEAPAPNAIPLTYPFSIASNASLRMPGIPAVTASLEVRFTPPARNDVLPGQPTLFKLTPAGWRPVPSYTLTGFGAALSASLDDDSALYSFGADYVEHYQLWWLPQTG